MLYVTIFIHGNLQYAEFSEQHIPAIVERSYLPTLERFAASPHLRGVFEFSGVSLEILSERWPQAIDLLRLMVERRQIEVLGSTYANPILPLIPTDHARRQLMAFCRIYDEIFGDLATPTGVYLQEFAYSPHLAPILRATGYHYTILTPELLHTGLRRQMNSAIHPMETRSLVKNLAWLELLHPINMIGAQGAQLTAVPFPRDLIDLLFNYSNGEIGFETIAELLLSLDGAHCRAAPGLLVLGPSDAEFIGFYEYHGRRAIQVEKLVEVMELIAQLPHVALGVPGEYLREHPAERAAYIPAGTSEPSFDIWTKDPDNQQLNSLCTEAAQKLYHLEQLHAVWGDEATEVILQTAWRAMMLAENSDGRGWIPCPERRLFCYDQAMEAIRQAGLLEEMLVPRMSIAP